MAGTHQTVYSKGKVHPLREASERDRVGGEGPSSLHRQECSTGKLASTAKSLDIVKAGLVPLLGRRVRGHS